jgi:hypothetical protein
MNSINFADRVKKHFVFLESDYGFKLIREGNSNVRPQTDGVVEYSSDTTVVVIDSETGYATVLLYRVKDGDKYYLTPVDINEYLNTTESEKELLLSTNPADQSLASALFNEKFLLNQPGWRGSHGTIEDLDKELNNFSNWLKAHANLCLKSDFSRWPEFYEYKIHRARAEHLRSGKNELGFVRAKDQDGNWKLVQQSIFKDKLEHAEKFKKEFSK